MTPTAHSLSVNPTRDLAWIDGVLRDPAVFPTIADDSCPDPQALSAAALLDNPASVFLRVEQDGAAVGFFAFLPTENPHEYELHTNLLPVCRGARALAAFRLAADYLFAHTDAREIVSFAFSNNPAAALMMRLAHFVARGEEPHRATVGGQQVDCRWYALARPAA
jgi:RimJ/RimL family protein N-acetyltransferase